MQYDLHFHYTQWSLTFSFDPCFSVIADEQFVSHYVSFDVCCLSRLLYCCFNNRHLNNLRLVRSRSGPSYLKNTSFSAYVNCTFDSEDLCIFRQSTKDAFNWTVQKVSYDCDKL